jgi:hypothetical protein
MPKKNQDSEEIKKHIQAVYDEFYSELNKIEAKLDDQMARIMKIIDKHQISKITKDLKK